MHPVLIDFGKVKLYGFGVSVVIGVFAAISIATWLGRKRGIHPDRISGLGFVTVVAGLLGARLFYFIQFHEQFAGKSLWRFFAIWEGGIVYYGGLLTGIVFGLLYAWRHRLALLPLMDAVAPALAVGLAFGRIGCLLNGCCFGAICPPDAFYGIQFPKEMGTDALRHTPVFDYQTHLPPDMRLSPDAALTYPVYPTQILASLDAFLLFGLLLWLSRRPRPAGELFFLWMTVYPIQRFLEEALRADNAPILFGMTISQAIGVPIFAAGIIGLLALRGRPDWVLPPPEAPAESPSPAGSGSSD